MQNINGHYIKWSETHNKFELVANVKCNICDQSIANQLCFLGFLVRQVRSFCEAKSLDEKYGMVGEALLLGKVQNFNPKLCTCGIFVQSY